MFIDDKMIDDKYFRIELELLINNNLYKKNLIDEDTYYYVQEKLLLELKERNI